jgi:hypothetical protein
VEGEQVGQVRHRQQQRRGVGQVGGRVDRRGAADLQPAHRAEQHRRQQHHRGVQREQRGGQRRDDEDQGEQPLGAAPAPHHEEPADPAEHPVHVGQVRDHQDRGQEADGRPERLDAGQRVRRADQAEQQGQPGGRHGGDRLRQAPRPGDGEAQYRRQQPDTDDGRQDRRHQPPPVRRGDRVTGASLSVVLDLLHAAHLDVVGVLAELAPGPALTQQVPALVQRPLKGHQLFALGVAGQLTPLELGAQLVLPIDQGRDLVQDLVFVHLFLLTALSDDCLMTV